MVNQKILEKYNEVFNENLTEEEYRQKMKANNTDTRQEETEIKEKYNNRNRVQRQKEKTKKLGEKIFSQNPDLLFNPKNEYEESIKELIFSSQGFISQIEERFGFQGLNWKEDAQVIYDLYEGSTARVRAIKFTRERTGWDLKKCREWVLENLK